MGFKHSPAPWRCHDKRPNCSGYSIVGNDGQYIGFVGDSDELSPMGANAHLIAAAPEMLALLMKLDKIGGLGLSTHKDIQSVITKALGQQ